MGSCRRIGRLAQTVMLAGLIAGAAGCVSRQDGPVDETALTLAPAAPEASAVSAAMPSAPAAPEAATPAPVPSIADATGTTEEITVVGRSFSGLWKVNSPKRLGMDVGLFSGVHIRYSGETGDRDICELRQTGTALDARCLRLARTAAGSVDGDDIVLRSWLGPANLILKATAQSGSMLQGTIGGGALGAQMTGGVPIRATKLSIPPDGTERPSAALLRAVLGDIAEGHLAAGRYAPEAAERLRRDLGDLQSDQAKLGALRDVAYLDQLLPRHPFDPHEHPLEVYRVEYAGGTRLCGISPGPPAAVADFICR